MDSLNPNGKRSFQQALRDIPRKILKKSAEAPSQPSSGMNSRSPSPSPSTSQVPVQSITPLPCSSAQVATGGWKRLETVLSALRKNTGLFPAVQSAVNALLPGVSVMEECFKNRQEFEELASKLTSLTGLLTEHTKSPTTSRMSGAIANLAGGIEEQAKLIESKLGRGKGRRLLEASKDEEELLKYYRRIASLFEQLQLDSSLSTWTAVNEQVLNARLDQLLPVQLANYDSKLSTGTSRRTCTDGTRIAILAGLDEWSHDNNAADIYWMNGMAGTGKTTIACSFSESLESRKQLAASFFCTRHVPDCREASRIIPTIAYQLAQYSMPFHSALCEAIVQDRGIGTKNLVKQFDRLLLEPLLKVREAIPSGLVVAIDALDECYDMLEVELLLSILLKHAKDIPIKFFVTSRPEPEIYERMMAQSRISRTVLHLHEVESLSVQADIELYLAAELELVSPAPSQLKELARRSGNLFIYAATLVRYIGGHKAKADPRRRLQAVLCMAPESTKQYAAVDALYTAVLQAALDEEDLEHWEVESIRSVLKTVICIQEPVSVQALAALAGLDDEEQTLTALQSLRAVLYVSEASGLVSTLHASFSDFMFDELRSRSFHCQLATHSELITRRCFRLMTSQLRFNICGLESSFVPDSQVQDLEDRAKRAISPILLYACRYWGHHLQDSTYGESMRMLLDTFLSNQLLFWMEVLNLKREIEICSYNILKAKQWLQVISGADIVRMVEDSQKFVTGFAANPVSQSTPHIYISWLPFYPKSSPLFKQYWPKMKGLVNVTGNAMWRRGTAALTTWKAGAQIFAIACSPDGCRVAVGCSKGSICIRNVHNGKHIVEPFNGHVGAVLSLAYSPDGTRLVSGSEDNTVKFWNAHDGTPVVIPFEGHTGSVWSVAYSPDGSRAISGSADGTIRAWDSQDGTPVVTLFEGRASMVWAVGYSPDGTRIVSGYEDSTIQVLNAFDGTPINTQFRNHRSSVLSVVYSPDGTRIVSGSDDGSIRVWGAHNGAAIIDLFTAHAGAVLSVGYSPSGACIISGSRDRTIQVRDAYNGALICAPFKGHTGSILSIVSSPDGTRILSGSDDKSIRVWNTHSGIPVTDPSTGYTSMQLLESARWQCAGRIRDVNLPLVLPRFLSHAGASYGQRNPAWPLTYPSGVNPIPPNPSSVDTTTAIRSERRTNPNYSFSVNYNGFDITLLSGRDLELFDAPYKQRSSYARSRESRVLSRLPIAYSPDSTRIASISPEGNLQLWSVHGGAPTALVSPLEWREQSWSGISSIAYSLDGAYIACGFANCAVRLWDTNRGEIAHNPLIGHHATVTSVMYSPNGMLVVSGSVDTTLRVWNTKSGTLFVGPLKGHSRAVTSVAFSPDGTRIVSGSCDHTVRVWNVHDGTPAASPFEGHTGAVYSVSYSPDGSQVVSGSGDHTIRIWNSCDGTLVAHPFEGHAHSVMSVAYSPDGRHIVSGARTIRVWDVRSGESIARLFGGNPESVTSVMCSTDGTRIVSAGRRGTIRVWKVPETPPAAGSPTSHTPLGLPPSDEGWVKSANAELLFWVPSELVPGCAALVPSPCCLAAISTRESIVLDFDGILYGELWDQCYVHV